MAAAVSYEQLEDRARRLLEEWGRYQREEPSPLVQGYPSVSIEGRAMRDHGRRTSDRSRAWAHRRQRRKDETNGRRRNVVVLAPERSDKGSRKGPPPMENWPDHVQAVDAVVASMPQVLVRAALDYYVRDMSIRMAAKYARCDRNEMDRRLDRVRCFLASRLEIVDQHI